MKRKPWPMVRTFAVHGLGMLLMLGCTVAQAEIVQGRLELQWGDPQGSAAGQPKQASRFVATLVADDGLRHALEPGEARRAAGDLYALANRRVAVEFSGSSRSLQPGRIEVIVPADRLQQKQAMSGANVSALATAISGNTRWVTVMCRFADITDEPKALAFFESQYGNNPGQLDHYWREVSYGKTNIAGSTAYGWVTLPQPRSFYVTQEDGKDKANLNKLFSDCGAAADPNLNFTGVQGINLMFNGDLDGFAWGGGSCAVLEGVNTCLRVTWNPPWAFNNIAVLAHEMGHGYGLPHSDNSDRDSDTYDNPWDVMSSTWNNAVSDPTFGSLPKHVNIYQRERLGWVDPARKQVIAAGAMAVVQVNLDRASLAGSLNKQMIVINLAQQPDPYKTTIYTLEVRKRTGNYESKLAGDAVIIHRVEEYGTAYSVDAQEPPANVSNNEGSMFKVGEAWLTPDHSRWVRVDAETPNGFLISIGPKPRLMSGPLPARLSPSAVSASQGPQSLQASDPVKPERAARPTCVAARGRVLEIWRCNTQVN